MSMLNKWKLHHPLQNQADLESFGAELLSSPHRERTIEHQDSSRHSAKTLVLRIDEKGSALIEEMRRSDILKMTQEAALSSALADVTLHPNDSRVSSSKESAVRQPDTASPRQNDQQRSFSIGHSSAAGGAPPVHMRDLRKLATAFAETTEPSIAVRKQAILIHADPMRAIIMRNACIVFIPDDADSLVTIVKDKFRELLTDRDAEVTPFEFRALEVVLFALSRLLFVDCTNTFPEIMKALERLANTPITSAELETLRSLKNTMNDFGLQIEGIRRELMSMLDNEDDLRGLYLTLEIHTIRTKVKLLEHRIQNTESLVMLKLDATRNHLLAVDVVFGLITVSLTIGMYITSGFGMNLRSGVEQSPGLFVPVFFGALALCALLVFVGVAYFRRHGVLSF